VSVPAERLAAVTLRPLLIPLFLLCGYLVAAGIIHLVEVIVEAFFGATHTVIGWIPFAGKLVGHSLHWLEGHITGKLGHWAADIDGKIGSTFHSLAYVWTLAAEEIYGLAHVLTVALWHLIVKNNPAALLLRVLHLERAERRLEALLLHPLRVLHQLEAEIARLSHGVTASLVHKLVHAAELPLIHDIARLRARARTIEDSLAKLYERVKGLEGVIGATAIVAAVAVALEKLGGGWIRCTNARKIGNTLCSSPVGDIEALLGLFAAGAVIADFRELVKLAQSVEHGVAVTLQDIAKI
jgi:hypothetical protein